MRIDNKFNLNAFVYENRNSMGKAAALDITAKINEFLKVKEELRIVFAAAPSQNETLEYLIKSKNIDWTRIIAFHMDEYIGLPQDAVQLFSRFLTNKLFDLVPFKEINIINGNNTDDECKRYGELIGQAPIDIVCMGIGENGHIAFNDPPVADFNDPEIIKSVKLDEVCRQQQVNDGCFKTIDDVPEYAYTLTIPTLMSGKNLFCVVPGETKNEAVKQTLNNPEITTAWPSTILRNHSSCNFYFDNDSCDV